MDMNNVLVSIIIPVYNNQDFLSKCLDSVIGQTYQNIEVILVDDGSQDNSGAICDEYQQRDARVKVFHRDNQGASLARQYGLGVAKGEFIQFVDSDDWMHLEKTEKMLHSALENDADIVWCDVEMVEKDGSHNFKLQFNPQSSSLLKSLYWGRVPGWLHNKLIKTAYLKDISFPKDWMMEDVFISTQLLLKNGRNSYVNEPLYAYNQLNENAATSKNNGNDILIKAMPNIENCYRCLLDNNVFTQYEEAFSCLAMRLKIAILKTKSIIDSKAVYTFAHKHLNSYGLQPPVAYIYWVGFNCGKLGEWLLAKYIKRR